MKSGIFFLMIKMPSVLSKGAENECSFTLLKGGHTGKAALKNVSIPQSLDSMPTLQFHFCNASQGRMEIHNQYPCMLCRRSEQL